MGDYVDKAKKAAYNRLYYQQNKEKWKRRNRGTRRSLGSAGGYMMSDYLKATKKAVKNRVRPDNYKPGSIGYEMYRKERKAESDELRDWYRKKGNERKSGIFYDEGQNEVKSRLKYRHDRWGNKHETGENNFSLAQDAHFTNELKKNARKAGISIPTHEKAREAGFRDVQQYIRYQLRKASEKKKK